MIHTFVGNLGQLSVIIAFVSALVAAFSFYKSVTGDDLQKTGWQSYAKGAFYIHSAAVLSVVICLYYIVYNHYFEYHYAWSHSSRQLPVYYMISCFWEGQEGSFLLWIFWNVVLGIVILNTNRVWTGSVMTIFALVQGFLTSMILGVVIFNVKIGSTPFILLRDAMMDAPVFQMNPDFVPEDGNGLNALLQNYWMVIHPPTLFLGFATTLVPFAYCIAGLWTGRIKEWIRPALPWALFSAMVLGVGILMGAYWAYETLNFGGYWNWDPVENAVYVPWLVLVASYHTMITYRKSSTALKTSVILVVATFILILYSTFLTRSGILGESSVHSFTDLGLSGQLLIYLLAFTALSVFLIVRRWKEIPSSDKEVSTYSREFWIFIGATTLCLMGFQVLLATSFPVYNSILNGIGIESNMALPADQVTYYTKFQMWFAVVLAVLSGTGQFFWWRKIDPQKLKETLMGPILITLVLSALGMWITNVTHLPYIILLVAAVYSVVANAKILWSLKKGSWHLSGGSVAHIGIAMMLIGIMYSSGYSKVVSLNKSGMLISREVDDEFNLENVILFLNEPREMDKYSLIYEGRNVEARGVPGYIPVESLSPTNDPYYWIAAENLVHKGRTFKSEGDTLEISPENIYFKIRYQQGNGKNFTLYPRIQVNASMGQVASPDIKRAAAKDLYTHLSYAPYMTEEETREWTHTDSLNVQIGQTFFINDFVAQLTEVTRVYNVKGLELEDDDIAVKASIAVNGDSKQYVLEPIFLIRDQRAARIPDVINDLGIRVAFSKINPETDSFDFDIYTTQKDFVILKAIEKPYINILWTGTLLLVVGYVIAIRRRYREFVQSRNKGLE
jgi:cytochrome c-type biogenesis protein CcmF